MAVVDGENEQAVVLVDERGAALAKVALVAESVQPGDAVEAQLVVSGWAPVLVETGKQLRQANS